MSSTTCLLHFLPYFFANFDIGMMSSFASAVSDVDPGNVAGQRTAEPAIAVKNATEQPIQEQTEEQPAVVTVAETVEEDLAEARAGASTPTRGDDAARGPPPSSVAEEGDKARLPRQLKKGWPQLRPGQRLLHRRAPLVGVRVL